MAIQLEFFNERSFDQEIKFELNEVKQSSDKVRRSLFARHAELAKKYAELHSRLEIIERNICRN